MQPTQYHILSFKFMFDKIDCFDSTKFSVYSSELQACRGVNERFIYLMMACRTPSPTESVEFKGFQPRLSWLNFFELRQSSNRILDALNKLFYPYLIVTSKIEITFLDYWYSLTSMLFTFYRQSQHFYYKNQVITGSYL
jgi:hypothetical protein